MKELIMFIRMDRTTRLLNPRPDVAHMGMCELPTREVKYARPTTYKYGIPPAATRPTVREHQCYLEDDEDEDGKAEYSSFEDEEFTLAGNALLSIAFIPPRMFFSDPKMGTECVL
jgi:hypothetical protein